MGLIHLISHQEDSISLMAGHCLRGGQWGTIWTKKDWIILTFSFTAIAFFLMRFRYRYSESQTISAFSTVDLVDLTLLQRAADTGAFCLDGSLPGYHFAKGFESGSDNWLLHIEGGGWCNTIASCWNRRMSALGSSKFMESPVQFSGLLSPDPSQNPDFFNWNKVKIRYCDGASFAGHPESEPKNSTKLHFRGQLIWEAIVDEILSLGMSSAKQALLSGCSAGGLATLIHCDEFREHLPKNITVKCLADAGFFLDEKDIRGKYTMRSFYHDVVNLQGVTKSLQKTCLDRMDLARDDRSKCMFAGEIMAGIRTPVFLINSAYDFWQIQHVLVPGGSDPHGYWRKCRLSLRHCFPDQLQRIQDFRAAFLKALELAMATDLGQSKEAAGWFVSSCFSHCQTWSSLTWHSPSSPRINNKTVAEAVGDWYFGRKTSKLIDCPYPCNPTCHDMDFT